MPTPAAFATTLSRIDPQRPLSVTAREFAAAGVPIFPCVPAGKRPMTEHGFKDATTDLDQVAAWWRDYPIANIGVPTGSVSGLVVIDVDVHGVDGHHAYARAARAGLIPEPLAVVRTPTGGRHVYFPAAPDRAERSWQAGKVGVDCRADGGYIIAPPSVLRLDGGRVPYRIEQIATSAVQPVDASRVRDFLDPRPPPRPRQGGPIRQADAMRLASWLAEQATDRNLKLFWAACRLAEGGVPVADALDALVAARKPDFREREIARTVYSAYRSTGCGTGARGVARDEHQSSEPRFMQHRIDRPSHKVRSL
ncbi:bifunctional DNA primase/polymerase [Nocardioides humi]|uniref:Primase C terminal 1 (PriCT-1) n=1 Tax=Nocardioides humi TaxID=449461 RepID=A0ABN2AJM0_9ACTN|nr:bifunctional DNA primase/polymerase [Nocardioides humi]